MVDYTYERFEHDISRIITGIHQDKINYEYICGIEKGGLIPAAVLSYRLGTPLLTINVDNLYTLDHTVIDYSPKVGRLLSAPSRKILMVDDTMESGGTAFKIEKHFDRLFDWAVLIFDMNSKHGCLHYGQIVPDSTYYKNVRFWWHG